MRKPSPARYHNINWSSYTASLRKRGSLLIWLDTEMTWLAPQDGSPGRPAVFSDAAIQFCLSIKILFRLPHRQTAGMDASLLRLAGLDWPVSDCTILCCRQKELAVLIPYRRVGGPLHLLFYSTGIKFLGDGEWQARKHGAQGRRQSLPGRRMHALAEKRAQGPSGHGPSHIRQAHPHHSVEHKGEKADDGVQSDLVGHLRDPVENEQTPVGHQNHPLDRKAHTANS